MENLGPRRTLEALRGNTLPAPPALQRAGYLFSGAGLEASITTGALGIQLT